MKVAIMQPYFFPFLGYFQLINHGDKFVFLDDVNFINRGWINRNRILLNGKDYMITVPLCGASQNRLINQIETAGTDWRQKILKTIEQAYRKAPQFNLVFGLLKEVLFFPVLDIAGLAKKSITTVCTFLDIDTLIIDSSAGFYKGTLKAEDRIIDINRKLNATNYINSLGGATLYDKQTFSKERIELQFLKTREVTYQQFRNEFVPSLSIIDVLMFNEKNEVKAMLAEYDLL